MGSGALVGADLDQDDRPSGRVVMVMAVMVPLRRHARSVGFGGRDVPATRKSKPRVRRLSNPVP